MGIYLSTLNNKNNNKYKESDLCYICRKNVDKNEIVTCVRCNINLHTVCEDIYRHNRNYCKCPKCGHIGSLGSTWAY
jgi:hypothetical protein